MRRAALLLLAACASQKAPLQADRPADDDVYFCRYKKNPTRLQDGQFSLGGLEATVLSMGRDTRDVGLELTVPWGSADQPLRATFTTGWVTYRLVYRPEKPLRLYPLTPQRVGVLELGAFTALDYLGNDNKLMRARVEPPSVFKPAQPIELRLRCDETAITSSGRGLDAVPETDGGTPEVLLAREVEIPVAATPNGEPEGSLRFGKDATPRADVLRSEEGAVEIRISTWPGRVTGWVPKRLTGPVEKGGMSNLYGALGGLGLGRQGGEGKPAWARCATGVPLFLVRNAALEPAGELLAKAAYEVVREADAWTGITLPENAWLKLEPGLSWALRPGDLKRCSLSPL